jgi:hypothetical protein
MIFEVEWLDGHPAGYTDDLGIIADKDEWVQEQLPGWYIRFIPEMAFEINAWCKENLQSHWKLISTGKWLGRTLFISDEKDLSWFLLKWS